jgi:hypothetical protein
MTTPREDRTQAVKEIDLALKYVGKQYLVTKHLDRAKFFLEQADRKETGFLRYESL